MPDEETQSDLSYGDQLAAARARIKQLEEEAAGPLPPPPLESLATEKLSRMLGDAVVDLLGGHPHIAHLWSLVRDRIDPPPPADDEPGE